MKNQLKVTLCDKTHSCAFNVDVNASLNFADYGLTNSRCENSLADIAHLSSLKAQIYTINSANQSAYWNGAQWVLTPISNWTPTAMTFDRQGRQWLIDRSGIVGIVNEETKLVTSYGKLGGWSIKELHFDLYGNKYCVSTDYKIGFWPANSNKWNDISNGVKALSISPSVTGELWCVDTQYRTTQWNPTDQKWEKKRLLGGRMLLQIAFGTVNELYCVTADHQISIRNLATNRWRDLGSLSRWGVLFVTFKYAV